jgi:aspartate/tyrosine/aromatic aminotransferase
LHFATANHHAIFKNVGIEAFEYPYYDPKTIGLDFTGFINTLKTAAPRSVFLLHACAHNPTGVDPTPEQWKVIADVMIEKKHYAFFDCAYQGFASGDLDKDAWAVRYFVDKGVAMLVCQVNWVVGSAYGWYVDCGMDRALRKMQDCMESGLARCILFFGPRRLRIG